MTSWRFDAPIMRMSLDGDIMWANQLGDGIGQMVDVETGAAQFHDRCQGGPKRQRGVRQ